jgi:uncharacterized membrane protein YedE/YeeE
MQPTTESSSSRISSPLRLALVGVVLFFVGFVLNGFANSATNLLWMTPYADTITALGFVFAILGAVRAGSSTREILIVGLVFGIGTFYVGEPHGPTLRLVLASN